MMIFDDFVTRIIDDGIQAATDDYTRPNQQNKLRGSVAGFEICRGKNVEELRELLAASATATHDACQRKSSDYWWYRCYEVEVEWVCNCTSALLHNQKLPTIVTPTVRGVMKAAEIVGVKGMN